MAVLCQHGKYNCDLCVVADEVAALRAEVERLTRERDEWMARAHTYDVERRRYHAARDAAQAKLAALREKGVAADNAVRRYALAVDWDNALHEAGCGCVQCELRGAFYRFRDALTAAQSGDGRKEDSDGE